MYPVRDEQPFDSPEEAVFYACHQKGFAAAEEEGKQVLRRVFMGRPEVAQIFKAGDLFYLNIRNAER